MTRTGELLVSIGILVFIFAMGLGVGGSISAKLHRNAAIEAGVARWVIDSTTGEREFVYGNVGVEP